jgi:hypothetical protein
LSHEFFCSSDAEECPSPLSPCVVIVDEYLLKFRAKPVGEEMMDNSITKRGNKYLSHHWISDIDEFVVTRFIGSCSNFVMKPETVFLVLLLKLKSFRSSSLATTAVKVCLKKVVKVHSIQRTDTVAARRIASVVDVTVVRINVEVLTIITRPQISVVTSIVELIIRWVNPFIPFSYSMRNIRKYF